jgi:predicted glycosyltransferase
MESVWPIFPGSEKAPANWQGWPEGKQFAVVLTHDVEGKAGYDKIPNLMELEQKLGFRSSFNLIPESREYQVEPGLRRRLAENGFEVGVHDLYHDGRLFLQESEFRRNAVKINHYLKEWGASGFRSGFMLHNLDWIHDLNVEYDASTFDTDPFEPQPHGQGTIFPFWVARNGQSGSQTVKTERAGLSSSGGPLIEGSRGYVELPYTLPQDSTLFLLFRERTNDIWLKKLDWIAKHGGMVLVNVHPDYVDFDGRRRGCEYPTAHYRDFLEFIASRYKGGFWNAPPKQVASLFKSSTRSLCESEALGRAEAVPQKAPAIICTHMGSGASARKPKIWFDLDNTPHVPLFEPVLEELRARGYPVLVTARDAFQVCDLADKKGMAYIKIGRHSGKNRLLKAIGLMHRALQLAPVVLREKPSLGVSHGSRSQLLLSNWLGRSTLLMEDYEFAKFPPMMHPTWVMAPTVIPESNLCVKPGNIRRYQGIKEDIYAWKLKPAPELLSELGIDDSEILVTVRPPATEAHYHNPEAERLFAALMERACQMPGLRVVLLPRNKKQGQEIIEQCPRWFENGKTVIPKGALDGMNLIWFSDLVVSGGGTMNREAAALGVPVYSIFRGTIGAVDNRLQQEGKLVLLESVEDVQRKIQFVKRGRKSLADATSRRVLHTVVDTIIELAEAAARS